MTETLDDILEAQFLLNYYGHITPDESDHYSTYEFRAYLKLLYEYRKKEQEDLINRMRSPNK